MEPLQTVSGVAAPLMRINIDTDQIIPTLFLGGIDATGYGEHLFHHLRYMPDGSRNPEFILNRKPFDKAQVLLADRNFGCGSSRERAPKALREFGFRAIIAPSFGGIFFNNCWRNGIVPVELPIEVVRRLAKLVEAGTGNMLVTVDLERQRVDAPDGSSYPFRSPGQLRKMLLAGADEIQLTLSLGALIAAYRAHDRERRPWAY
jgi:3-isopropylmalate/(R)-2-methylmalate dehydratase small subunit